MDQRVELRKIAGWEFFNNNVDVCDLVRPGGIKALEANARAVAELFIAALGGHRRILDVGCGSGFPGLYVASYVDELVGLDLALDPVVDLDLHRDPRSPNQEEAGQLFRR